MIKKIVFLLFLILIPSALCEDLTLREGMTLDLDMHSSVGVNIASSGMLDYVKVDINYVLLNTNNQQILTTKTTPQATIGDDIIFEWDNPTVFPLEYDVKSSIVTSSKRKEITNKVDFPISQLPSDIYEYTKPTSLIDTNDDIKKLASKLSENEDDLYIVTFSLASWTNKNIKYDLSSVAADAVEKSSWVLTNRVGVCDEITNLFISLCRSQGIPARFVTGVSYTNDPRFEKPWGLHGWAEVYFPDYGWVPFDPTYGEFGYIDAGHIKLKDGFDSNKSSTEFEWKGAHADISPEPLLFDVNVLNKGAMSAPPADLSVQVFDDKVGFGSYNLVEAIVENTHNYYTTLNLAVSLPKEVSIEGDKNVPIILNPYEKKSISWIIQVPKTLKENYRYTFPSAVTVSQQNYTVESQFESSKDDNIIDYATIQDVASKKESVSTKDDGVSFFCSANKNEIDVNETLILQCFIENNLTTPINGLNVCLADECKSINVAAKKQAAVSFEKSFGTPGYIVMSATAKNNEVSKIFFENIMVLDYPKLEITNLKYPKSVNFDDTFTIAFTLKKDSYASALNPQVIIYHDKNHDSWNLTNIAGVQPFSFQLSGSYLKFNDNNFRAIVNYEDDKGKIYQTESDFVITLENTTWTQKLQVLLNQFSFWIDRMINK